MTESSRDPLLIGQNTDDSSDRSGTPPPTYEIVMQEKKNGFVYNKGILYSAVFFIIFFIVLYVYWKKDK